MVSISTSKKELNEEYLNISASGSFIDVCIYNYTYFEKIILHIKISHILVQKDDDTEITTFS